MIAISSDRERGQAVLQAQDLATAAEAEKAAKKRRLDNGLGDQRVENLEELQALAAVRGSTQALAHQATLWNVPPGKSKATTLARLSQAVRASQGDMQGEDEGEDADDEHPFI